VLWIEPTAETPSGPSRDELNDESIDLVEDEPTFSSRADADNFVRDLEFATTTTTSTTTTEPRATTTTPTTDAPEATSPSAITTAP
jgi:hypothetical protein